MKRYKFLLISVVLVVFLAGCSHKTVQDISGKQIKLADYQNSWVIINYWASWCKPCLEEMPALSKLYQDMKGSVLVLGVNFDNMTPEKQQGYADKLNVKYPLLVSAPMQYFQLPKEAPRVLPVTYFFAPGGKLVKTLQGPQTEASLAQALNQAKHA